MAFQAALNLSITEDNGNIANNTSIVTVDVSVQLSNSSSASSQTSSTCSITCAGQTKMITVGSYSIGTNGSKKLGSVSFTIAHNVDGNKTISCNASWTIPYTNGFTAKGTASKTLKKIPRASTFSAPTTATLGTSFTINITRADSSFTHKLYYNILGGSSNWVLFASNVGTSYSYTPSLSFANSHPNDATFTMYIGVDTYSGSSKIGDSNNAGNPIKISVPASIAPSVSSMSITRIDNGVPSSWNTYVKGFSKAKVSVTGTGSYGSTITDYTITGAGFTSNSNVLETDALQIPGTNSFTCTVKDSRGKSKSSTQSITVVDYVMPSVSLSAERCTSTGTVDADGTYVKVTATYTIASVNGKNSVASRKIEIEGTSYNHTTFSSGVAVVLGGAVSTNQPYNIKVTIKDTLGKSAIANVKIPTGAVIFDIKDDGKGISFGKVAQKSDLLDSVWPIATEGYLSASEYNLHDKDNAWMGSVAIDANKVMTLLNSKGDVALDNGQEKIILRRSGSSSYSSYLIPFNNAKCTLGTTAARWNGYYGSIGDNISSDLRLKDHIHSFDERYEAMYTDLRPVMYELKAAPGQMHCGLIAQWTKEAMDEHGIEEAEFGVYRYEKFFDDYGIVYDELPAYNMHMVQRLLKRIDYLESRITNLENKITDER